MSERQPAGVLDRGDAGMLEPAPVSDGAASSCRLAAGEARRYATDNPGSSPEHEGLFPGWVNEAAHQNADALALLGIEDPPQPKPDMPRQPRPAPDSSWFDRPAGGWVSGTRGRSL